MNRSNKPRRTAKTLAEGDSNGSNRFFNGKMNRSWAHGLIVRIMFIGLMIGLPVSAQDSVTNESGEAPAVVSSTLPPTILHDQEVYLRRVDGQWTASFSGDLADPDTERVLVSLEGKPHRVRAPSLSGGSQLCLTKMKDRAQYGYLECNSAFYSVNVGSSATGTLLRGVLSLGILTVTDAASGNTGFSVSVDQSAVDAAVAESKALELIRENIPRLEYGRTLLHMTKSPALKEFITRYKGIPGQEEWVAKAEAHLAREIEEETLQAQKKAAEEVQQAEARRQKDLQRQAEFDQLKQWQAKLQPGDKVRLNLQGGYVATGMVIEVKSSLAYVQWDILTPPMRWHRLEELLPVR